MRAYAGPFAGAVKLFALHTSEKGLLGSTNLMQIPVPELFLALFDAPGESYGGGVAPFEYELQQHFGPILVRHNAFYVPSLPLFWNDRLVSCPQTKASKSIRAGIPHGGTNSFKSECVMILRHVLSQCYAIS